jgi:hypothetical protein
MSGTSRLPPDEVPMLSFRLGCIKEWGYSERIQDTQDVRDPHAWRPVPNSRVTK